RAVEPRPVGLGVDRTGGLAGGGRDQLELDEVLGAALGDRALDDAVDLELLRGLLEVPLRAARALPLLRGDHGVLPLDQLDDALVKLLRLLALEREHDHAAALRVRGTETQHDEREDQDATCRNFRSRTRHYRLRIWNRRPATSPADDRRRRR